MYSIKMKIRYIRYLPGIFLCILYFIFHFHFMPQYVDWDQALYGHNIIIGVTHNTTPIFNPPHLHEEIGGIFFHRLMESVLGKAGFTDIIFNNRIRSLIFACIGIYFTFLFLKNITGKTIWGFSGGLLVSVCHGYMVFSTKVDTAIFPVTGIIVTLWLLNRIEYAKKHVIIYSILAGIILFIDIMFHQYLGIACVIFCIAISLPPYFFPVKPLWKNFIKIRNEKKPEIDEIPRTRYSATGIIILICLVLTGAAYFYTGVAVYKLPFDKPSPIAHNGPFKNIIFQKWIFLYGLFGGYGHGYKSWNPMKPFRGYTNAFLSPTVEQKKRYDTLTFQYNIRNFFKKESFIYNQVAIFSIIGLICPLIFIVLMWKRYRRSFFFIMSSLIIFILFTTYWEPYYYEFWLIPCFFICILAIMFCNLIGEGLSLFFRRFAQTPFYVYIFFIILCLFSFNSERHIIPYSRERRMEELYPPWTLADFLKLYSTTIYKHPDDPYKTIYPAENK
ncbi:MAG: hypothetical protein JXJ04_20550 [Spirochaetales bacterium]|nr:hypothetical protein [Spirochaetales bacterium]